MKKLIIGGVAIAVLDYLGLWGIYINLITRMQPNF